MHMSCRINHCVFTREWTESDQDGQEGMVDVKGLRGVMKCSSRIPSHKASEMSHNEIRERDQVIRGRTMLENGNNLLRHECQ